MKSKFVYFVLVLVTVYIAIMYQDSKAIAFLGFELLLFICMFFLAWYLKRGITVHLESKLPIAGKQKAVPVKIYIKNRHRLPAAQILIRLVYENDYSYHSGNETFWCSVDGQEEKILHYDMLAEYCGRIHFSISKIKVYDYLKLWSFPIKCKEEIQISILPDIHEIIASVSEHTRNFPIEGEEYDPRQSGDDPSEIFQTREFRAGDTLQRVHWKMSAKTDELITKEYSKPIGCSVLLLLDLHFNKIQQNYGNPFLQMDAFWEIAASVSYGLMTAGCRHYTAWFEEETGCVGRQYVQEEAQVYEMIHRALHLTPYLQKYELLSGYQAEHREAHFSTILILNTDLQLIKNGEVIAEFSKDKASEMLNGLLLEV